MSDEEKGFLVLDAVGIPRSQTIDSIVEYANKNKTVVWDSSYGGEKPYILGSLDKELIIKDVNELKD